VVVAGLALAPLVGVVVTVRMVAMAVRVPVVVVVLLVVVVAAAATFLVPPVRVVVEPQQVLPPVVHRVEEAFLMKKTQEKCA
jgi:hypothetical protein